MLDLRRLDDTISVAPQLSPEDLAAIKAAGFVAVINNRPDDEEPGQPSAIALQHAAEAAGLAYTALPVGHGFTHAQVAAMRGALDAADGPVLAFCRSGTRSTYLWALARAAAGDDPADLAAKAAGAGYDLTPLAPLLEQLRP
jgi:uncharacterized protein (TIGR01244 family)